ncbi:MAG: ATP-dependent protease ATPase subunit HslU [Candidatus Acetothermia bacterium]|nr:ATP-dependent protease ATPase subunit HslU [Candidatus Acetothermia bacterium]
MTRLPGLTPREVVRELDRHIVGQEAAKRAVAVALRNRVRRAALPPELRREVRPKNILMIGPTGVGKTEIARRLAQITDSPFLKVEATRYTEVGYVGRDVESMVRDLVEAAIAMVRAREARRLAAEVDRWAEERLLDALLAGVAGGEGARDRLRERLRAGELEEQWVEIPVREPLVPQVSVFSEAGMDQLGIDLSDLFAGFPAPRRAKRMTVRGARTVLKEEALDGLLNMEEIRGEAIRAVEESGIIFIDELDKLAMSGREERYGPGVSRQGVQRDLLPLLEGTTVRTRHGNVNTEGILFIAAGAFTAAKPSDLMPELQGRLPIRVELHPLSEDHLRRILTEPEDALTTQYRALLATEGVDLVFADDAIAAMAKVAADLNQTLEDIGARRLFTVVEKAMEDLSFSAEDHAGKRVVIDAAYVREKLAGLAGDVDLSRYIL